MYICRLQKMAVEKGSLSVIFEWERKFRKGPQKRQDFMVSGVSLLEGRVGRREEGNFWREGRGTDFLPDDFCFLTVHETFTFLICYLAKCLYVYLNTQEHHNLTCNKVLLIRRWKKWPVLFTSYPTKTSFEWFLFAEKNTLDEMVLNHKR